MAVSKSMDFPGSIKTSSYTQKVIEAQSFPETTQINFVPVPGPQGPQGPKGDKGDPGQNGISGQDGKDGKDGKNGRNGKDGKDGQDLISISGQKSGWAKYINTYPLQHQLGIDKGDDGWVQMFLTAANNKNESFIPGVSFWNDLTKRINLKGLNIGAYVSIKYSMLLTTFSSNTDVWIKTQIADKPDFDATFIGCLKYQDSYNLEVNQTIFIEDESFKTSGIPMIRTDFPASVILNSITIFVS